MTLTEGRGPVTFSYIDSLCSVPSTLFDCMNAVVLFIFLLFKTTIAVMKTTKLIVKIIATELKNIIYTILTAEVYMSSVSVVSELCVAWLSVGCMVPVGVLIVGSVV